jgi:hypothetical protein
MVDRTENPARRSRNRSPGSHVGKSLLVHDDSWKSQLFKKRWSSLSRETRRAAEKQWDRMSVCEKRQWRSQIAVWCAGAFASGKKSWPGQGG